MEFSNQKFEQTVTLKMGSEMDHSMIMSLKTWHLYSCTQYVHSHATSLASWICPSHLRAHLFHTELFSVFSLFLVSVSPQPIHISSTLISIHCYSIQTFCSKLVNAKIINCGKDRRIERWKKWAWQHFSFY